jgi:tetratricopeptide (TPR) repeat protein
MGMCSCLLQATKLDPLCYSCYQYLGHYYSLGGKDLDKARRCYQKAFHLNPSCKESGAALSDIYRLQKNPVSAIISFPSSYFIPYRNQHFCFLLLSILASFIWQ